MAVPTSASGADLMMGSDGHGTFAQMELGDLHLSAVSEAMNQMMGTAATSMAVLFKFPVDISTPDVSSIDVDSVKKFLLNPVFPVSDRGLAVKTMKIAFENTKIKGYLEYIITNINRDNVGVCLDIGHSHAHFDDDFNFELFKDKIFAIHVHDNDGTADQHLIPGDGNINWNYYIEGLKKANYKAPVSIESCYRDIYTDPEDFYKKCYQKAIEIANHL